MAAISGRQREAKIIRRANRAAAVGRLMLGEFDNWQDFLQADVDDLENLPRRQLKSGKADVKDRLSSEIRKFCSINFKGMSDQTLSTLYEEVKRFRGMEMPLEEFEHKFAVIRPEILQGRPKHLTVCISLWGLQFKFPEEELVKDLTISIQLINDVSTTIENYESNSHSNIKNNRDLISSLISKKYFCLRSLIVGCFNLIEAYLNGLSWDYIKSHGAATLSNRRKNLLEDTISVSIRDKLIKYPTILTDRPLWQEPDDELEAFLSTIKPFRDSLVHPSPFSVPAKFGGHDKLQLFYRLDNDIGIVTMSLLVKLIKRIHKHIFGQSQKLPEWIMSLEQAATNFGSIEIVES